MDRIYAAILSLLGFVFLLGTWIIFMFVGLPADQSVFLEGIAIGSGALSPSNPEAFLFGTTLVACVACGLSAFLFFTRKPRAALAMVAVNALVAVFLYSVSVAILLGSPLLLSRRVLKNA
ncbi:hypothetical protein [Marinobacter sp. HN1S83]|uniref:hypothetical protein n=1 Tax=Marinobacter sp. HN1S83 TaxID=3382301 RepID=UPI00387B34E6